MNKFSKLTESHTILTKFNCVFTFHIARSWPKVPLYIMFIDNIWVNTSVINSNIETVPGWMISIKFLIHLMVKQDSHDCTETEISAMHALVSVTRGPRRGFAARATKELWLRQPHKDSCPSRRIGKRVAVGTSFYYPVSWESETKLL